MNELHDAHVNSLKEELYMYISDVSKEAYGFRARMDISGMTVAELEAELDHYYKAAERTAREEAEAEARNVVKFEAMIQRMIGYGAGDRATAVRWLRDANDSPMGDDSILWNYGLPWGYDLDTGGNKYLKSA